jgi:intracellular multiplication protein IcmE
MNDTSKKARLPLLANAKARVFMALALIVIVVAAIGYVIHVRSRESANQAVAVVSGTPDISSTPGAGNPSEAYIKAQNLANMEGEAAARKSATAFVPTITRPDFVGNPDQFGQATTDAASGVRCPINNVVMTYKPNPASCTENNLKLARETGVTAEELMCQGCSCPALKSVGYTVGELKNIGLSATQLSACGFDLQSLINAGFSPSDLKTAGFTAQQLKAAGLSAGELKAAGFSAGDLKAAGFSAGDLKAAGFSAGDLKAAGFLPANETVSANCSAEKLKQERESGVSGSVLRGQGCGLAALKAAGFSANALRSAGFTAAQLKDAGFSAGALKAAGFSAADLKNAGFTAGQMVSAGFSPKELRAAGFSAKQLREAGVSASALRAAGFTSSELRAAGFTKGDLVRAGFSPKESGYQDGPSLTQTDDTGNDDAGNIASQPTGEVLPSIDSSSPEARLAQFEKQQQADMTAQQRRDHIQKLQAFMNGQAQKLLTGWSNVSTQQYQLAPAPAKENNANNGSSGSSAGGLSATNAQGSDANGGPVIKAGSILFAVIQTSINSDENTPIMARIVTGDLNGSKLLGTFSRQNKRLLITFNLLNDPRYSKSIPINAVAIDPDTARTALSGQVNNHYLLRYGTLFASSFLQGISQAIMNQNVTENCLIGTFGCTVQQTPLNSRQQVLVGFGKVGEAYGQHMGSNFNRAPTVRVPAGTGIGVLVMGDLTLPKNPLPEESQSMSNGVYSHDG